VTPVTEAVQTELCHFATADRERLHALLFRSREKSESQLALVMIHGVAMNFYTGPLPVFSRLLAERGYHVLCMNTRGHDWISRAGNLTAFGGAAYENFEDCLHDLDAALKWLGSRSYRRFVLVGHSLGAVKSLFYQGTRRRSDIAGIVSCSAPKQFYSARAVEQPDFPGRMAEAETMVSAGRGEEFLWAPSSGATGIFSARTYINKYGCHEQTDVRPYAARLGCPLLAAAGSKEHSFFIEYARELAEAAGGHMDACHILEGGKHFYLRREPVMTEIIAQWLVRLDMG
jgi:pimeloyl-ACP methyl ester carboxylesterase